MAKKKSKEQNTYNARPNARTTSYTSAIEHTSIPAVQYPQRHNFGSIDYETYENLTTASSNGTLTINGTLVSATGPMTYQNSITYGTTATFVGYQNIPIYWLSSPKIFENEHISISDNGEILVNGKVELNPLKIGRALLNAVESLKLENINKPKEFFK